jgi:hypothetical protein
MLRPTPPQDYAIVLSAFVFLGAYIYQQRVGETNTERTVMLYDGAAALWAAPLLRARQQQGCGPATVPMCLCLETLNPALGNPDDPPGRLASDSAPPAMMGPRCTACCAATIPLPHMNPNSNPSPRSHHLPAAR